MFAQTRKHIDAVDEDRNPLTFELRVTGKVSEPEKSITVNDATESVVYPDVKDQMALLLFGMPFEELDNNAGSGILTKGGEVITQALIASVERQARSFTGLDEIRVEDQGAFFGNALGEQPTLSLGKYLTSNLYLEYKSKFSKVGGVPTPQLSWKRATRYPCNIA